MKVVSPRPGPTPDPLLRLVRRALMQEARCELIKARLEFRALSRKGRRMRRGRAAQPPTAAATTAATRKTR